MSWFTNFWGKIFGKTNTETIIVETETDSNKKALIIGINKWQYLSGSNLNGCVNDANNLYNLFIKEFGFSKSNIKKLLDYNATKSAIVDGLKWLVKDAKAEDLLVFTMSSHGTQTDDKDGDESDGQDEAVCPADLSYNNWEDGLLRDDEIYEIIKDIPNGCELVLVVDACHSGSVSRDIKRKRFLPAPIRFCKKNGKIRRFGRANDGRTQNHILIAGCQDDQTSADAFVDGDYNGALTWSLCKAIKENTKNTYKKMVNRTIEIVKENGWEQDPNYLSNNDLDNRIIFGGNKIKQ